MVSDKMMISIPSLISSTMMWMVSVTCRVGDVCSRVEQRILDSSDCKLVHVEKASRSLSLLKYRVDHGP